MTDGDQSGFKIVYLKKQHPIRVKYPLSDDMEGRVKSLAETDISIDESAPILAEICIDRHYSDTEAWKRILSTAKNLSGVLRLFVEVY